MSRRHRELSELVDVVTPNSFSRNSGGRLDERLFRVAPVNSSVSGSTVAKNAASIGEQRPQPPQRLGLEVGRRRSPTVAQPLQLAQPPRSRRRRHTRQATTRQAERHRGAAQLGTAELVEATPTLDDLAVANPEDVDARQRDRSPTAAKSEARTLLRARRGEPLDDDVALGEQDVQVAVPVRERLRDNVPRRPHPSGQPTPQAVVHHEVRRQVGVHGTEIAVGEQSVDE